MAAFNAFRLQPWLELLDFCSFDIIAKEFLGQRRHSFRVRVAILITYHCHFRQACMVCLARSPTMLPFEGGLRGAIIILAASGMAKRRAAYIRKPTFESELLVRTHNVDKVYTHVSTQVVLHALLEKSAKLRVFERWK